MKIFTTLFKENETRNQLPPILVLTFILGLTCINKFWAPYDDGISLSSSELIYNGYVPYKDFILLYAPLQFYITAFLFKLFGASHIVARLFTVLMYTTICLITYYLTKKASQNPRVAFFAWLICAASLVPRLGASLSTMWEGMGFAFIGMFFMCKFFEFRKYVFLAAGAFASGLAALSRQDMGSYAALASVSALFILTFSEEDTLASKMRCFFRNSIFFSLAFLVPISLFFIYLRSHNAIPDFLYSMQLVSPRTPVGIESSLHLSPICWDLRQIFYGSLNFISMNQFYIPFLAYVTSIFLFVSLYFSGNDKRGLARYAATITLFSIFGIFTYLYILYRPDDHHLLYALAPSAVVFGLIYAGITDKTFKLPFSLKVCFRVLFALLFFLFVLLIIKNFDKYSKNVFVKPYFDKKILRLSSKKGSIYIPKDQYEPVKNVISFIIKNTTKGEKIFIWNKGASGTFLGTDMLVYFFTDTLPGTENFIVMPGYTNTADVQNKIIASLKKNAVKLVVLLGDKNTGNWNEADRGLIDDYVETNFTLAERIGYFYVYLKK
ncbi:MAG: glycosyltransferase family 39 protein [Candidatus Omnitrophica bacterium]|nr:glycosyltransferase family 39 protein [Candidatus Omnitrophota bacterium]